MKTILITGGAGFIGSHLADTTVAAGYRTIIFDNLSTGERSNVPKAALFVRGDVRRPKQVQSVFKKYPIDVVFHVAGQASPITSYKNPTYDIDENYVGTVHVVCASIAHGVRRFLYASSMTVYGDVPNRPVAEAQRCVPISYYGISKYAAERFVHATSVRNDLPHPFTVTSLRMFNVYGPRQSLTNPYQGVMAIFIGNILRNEPIVLYGDGKQSRDFLYIDDVVRAWITSLNAPASYNQVINVASGERISLLDLVRQLIILFGRDPKTYPIIHKEARSGEQRHMQADIRKAKKLLGFAPKISLDQGLRRTIAWAKSRSREI